MLFSLINIFYFTFNLQLFFSILLLRITLLIHVILLIRQLFLE